MKTLQPLAAMKVQSLLLTSVITNSFLSGVTVLIFPLASAARAGATRQSRQTITTGSSQILGSRFIAHSSCCRLEPRPFVPAHREQATTADIQTLPCISVTSDEAG